MAKAPCALALSVLLVTGCAARGRGLAPPASPAPPTEARASAQSRALVLRGAVLRAAGDLAGADQALQAADLLDQGGPWVVLARADLAFDEGRLENAVSLWQEALRRDPACADALTHLGWIAFAQGQLDVAEEQFGLALAADANWRARAGLVEALQGQGRNDDARLALADWPPPSGRWAQRHELRALARVRLGVGDTDRGLNELSEYLDLVPDDLEAIELFVRTARAARRSGTALRELDHLRSLRPDDVGVAQHRYWLVDDLGDPVRKPGALDDLLRLLPHPSPELLLERARLELAGGRLAEASATLVRCAGAVPVGTPVPHQLHRLQAEVAAAQGDLPGALALLSPDQVADASLRADLLRRAGRADEADLELDRALKRWPDLTVLAVQRARSHVHRGDLVAAEAQLRRALPPERVPLQLSALLAQDGRILDAVAALGPMPPDVDRFTRLAPLYLALDDPDRAARAVEAGLALDPTSVELRLLDGHVALARGDRALALTRWEAGLALRPDEPDLLNAVGYGLAEQRGDLVRAEQLLLRALDASPVDGRYMDSLGWIYFQAGRPEDAVLQLEQAIAYAPLEPEIVAHLAAARAAVAAP
jgi:tetratricopeptide (TPR) repeat protein